MAQTENNPSDLDAASEDLFNYAIDREDVKWLMARFPEASAVQKSTVENELQMLKLISVGWSITFYLENSVWKTPLAERYWKQVFDFSKSLSTATGLMTGHEIDYFQSLKDRLDMYVSALARQPDATEPAQVIGPEFAGACGNREDLFAFMTGSKLFLSVVGRVKDYLEALRLI